MVALSSAPFVFVVVCSMFVVTSQKCPNGTIETQPNRCLYIQDSRKMENETWRRSRLYAYTTACENLKDRMSRDYTWRLPSFQSIDKQAKLYEILGRNRPHRRHFWIRLIRQWFGKSIEKPMNDTAYWKWGKEGDLTKLSENDLFRRFPAWADSEPNEAYLGYDIEVCVISRETSDDKYPWFEWIVTPCELDPALDETTKNLHEAMQTDGILICEGTRKPRRTTTPCVCGTGESTTSSTAPAAISSTSSTTSEPPATTSGNVSATCEPPATTTPARSIVWHPAFISILVSLACMTAFFLACGVYVWFKQRRIRELKARIKKSEYASTTSSGMTSMSTIISIDDSSRRDDDSDDGSKRKRSRSKGKKKGRGKK